MKKRRSVKILIILRISVIIFISFAISISNLKCTQQQKPYRVGILCGLDFFADTIDGFKEQMKILGYTEGKDIVYDVHTIQSDSQNAKQIIKKLIDDKVDLIFTMPTDVSLIAKRLTKDSGIPVLFANANVEGVNLVNSIKEPGENITGVRYPGPDLTIKRFEIMREIIPSLKKILVPYRRGIDIVPIQLKVLKQAADAAGISIIEAPAADEHELKEVISDYKKNKSIRFDAILVIAEPLMVMPLTFKIIAEYADLKKIPIGGALMQVDEYASIFGVSTNNVSVGRQAAPIAIKILNGINAGSIPVASAENFLQINYKEIQRLGLNVPPGILKQANEIIK